jgi:exonuclease VII small subunit
MDRLEEAKQILARIENEIPALERAIALGEEMMDHGHTPIDVERLRVALFMLKRVKPLMESLKFDADGRIVEMEEDKPLLRWLRERLFKSEESENA